MRKELFDSKTSQLNLIVPRDNNINPDSRGKYLSVVKPGNCSEINN